MGVCVYKNVGITSTNMHYLCVGYRFPKLLVGWLIGVSFPDEQCECDDATSFREFEYRITPNQIGSTVT